MFLEDGVDCSGPGEWFGFAVVVLDELVDSGDEFFDALERSGPDGLLRDESEPSVDLIEPGRVSGRELEMEVQQNAGATCRPSA